MVANVNLESYLMNWKIKESQKVRIKRKRRRRIRIRKKKRRRRKRKRKRKRSKELRTRRSTSLPPSALGDFLVLGDIYRFTEFHKSRWQKVDIDSFFFN